MEVCGGTWRKCVSTAECEWNGSFLEHVALSKEFNDVHLTRRSEPDECGKGN